MPGLSKTEKVIIPLKGWKGLWDRGALEDCPSDHLTDLLGMFCRDGELTTRPGFTKIANVPINAVVSSFPIHTQYVSNPTATNRSAWLLGTNAGQLAYVTFDGVLTTTTVSLGIFANWAGVLSAVQDGFRIYVSLWPSGINIKVIDITNPLVPTIRDLGGAAPGGPAMAIAIGGAGRIERGTHIYKVAFETSSGFITKLSTTAFIAFTSNGNEFHNLSVIPTGPAGTVARWIFTTKSIQRYNNDHLNQEYFFLPGGRIADNVTTVLNNISYYDADLFKSADYLLDQLEVVKSGRKLAMYNNRLVVASPTTFVSPDADTIYISKSGEPESFDAVDGAINTIPETMGGVLDIGEYRGILYIFKDSNTLATQDNDDVPSSWKVETVDTEKTILHDPSRTAWFSATSPFGPGFFSFQGSNKAIGEYFGQKAIVDDALLVACKDGLFTFKGTYLLELSYDIRSLWERMFVNNPSQFSSGNMITSFVVDVENKLFFIKGPSNLGAGPAVDILVGDWSHGLTPGAIQWYKFQSGLTAIDDMSTDTRVVPGGSASTKMPLVIWSVDTIGVLFARMDSARQNDGQFDFGGVLQNVRIPQVVQFPRLFLEQNWVHHLDYMQATISDPNATVQWNLVLTTPNSVSTIALPLLGASKSGFDKLLNIKATRILPKLELPAIAGNISSATRIIEVKFTMNKIWLVPGAIL